MKFTNRVPTDWKELQNFVAEYLIAAGYKAITPYEIDTARGKVEIDVCIESPYDLVKRIVCECKYWSTPVTKEKIHAFRTVVYDCGAELGIIISKSGYQSGAIEAAKFSNVRLETWETFLELIKDKWLDNKLWSIKTMTARVMNYRDTYEYEVEKLTSEEVPRYKDTCQNIAHIAEQGLLVRKSDLINDTDFIKRFPLFDQNGFASRFFSHHDILHSFDPPPGKSGDDKSPAVIFVTTGLCKVSIFCFQENSKY